MFILLFVITLISGIRKVRGVPDQQGNDDVSTAPLYTPVQNDTW